MLGVQNVQLSYPADSTYEREKLSILQTLNIQIQNMAVKMDKIVTQTEEMYFQVKPHQQPLRPSVSSQSLITMTDPNVTGEFKKEPKKLKAVSKANRAACSTLNSSNLYTVSGSGTPKAADSSSKRNKQQRQFNTFVRESINQLLGADFMKTHDVQDIDAQVMEMIRKEAVDNYLPDNIRPRRAWHLAKASLRTLKRTLNNRKE